MDELQLTGEIYGMITRKMEQLKVDDIGMAAFCIICDNEQTKILSEHQEKVLEMVILNDMIEDIDELIQELV